MAKKRKPDTQPEEKEAEVFDNIKVLAANFHPVDPERLQRGLAALHESFKAYKKQTDARLDELKGIIEGVARRMREGRQ